MRLSTTCRQHFFKKPLVSFGGKDNAAYTTRMSYTKTSNSTEQCVRPSANHHNANSSQLVASLL